MNKHVEWTPYVYVASSWRCDRHPVVVAALRAVGIDCYDFKNDEGAQFHWSEVGVNSEVENVADYRAALGMDRAVAGFNSDFNALKRASHCLLVLPCGRSAHLELGWAVGAGTPTAILLEPNLLVTPPELMYKMVDHLFTGLPQVMDWVRL